MKLIDSLQTIEESEISMFWQFIESINWSPGANCKARLLRELSPNQSTKYKRILNYICEQFAEDLSVNFNFNKIFEAKAYCSNIIGEHGYQGLVDLQNNPTKAVKEIESRTFNDLEEIFLLMVPDDDDYWS